MNDTQKSQIENMRMAGIGYTKIAKELKLSENTVKSFCRRNNLTKPEKITASQQKEPSIKDYFCRQCGKAVAQNDKKKREKVLL
jgi:hypothetical protein